MIITDVTQATWQFLWRNARTKLLIACLITIASTGFIAVFFPNGSLILLPGVLFLSWYLKVKLRLQAQFIKQFAEVNNFAYCPDELPTLILGSPFQLGEDHTFTDLVKGSIDNLPFEYFAYSFVTGYGRNRGTSTITVMAFQLSHGVPEIFASKLSSTLEPPLDTTHLTFGNEFDDYYRVNIAPGTDMEALQIFEPDLMAKLIDQPHHFDFELCDGTLYLYANGRVSKKVVLDSLLAFATAISKRFEHEISSLHYTPAVQATVPASLILINSMRHYSGVAYDILTFTAIIGGALAFAISFAASREFRTLTASSGLGSLFLGLMLLRWKKYL